MVEYYPLIKLTHLASVIASGSLFALRGVLVLAGRGVANHPRVRRLSYAIDTVLLAAGATLLVVLRIHPGSQAWLAAKLALLVVYIVLGSFALRRARTTRARLLCFAGAIGIFLFMISIALAHDPRGLFRGAMR